MDLAYILVAVTLVSLASLAGVAYLWVSEPRLAKLMPWLVALAAGALLGTSFFDLIPEAVTALPETYGPYIVAGILAFLVFEQLAHWHHTHSHDCSDDSHKLATGYTALLGDIIHNFLDGILIAAAFAVNPQTGIATTIAVVLHEIPQELSDFTVLIHSGFSRSRALLANFLSSLSAIAGALLGYFVLNQVSTITPYLVAIGAGGLLYISLVDLFDEVKAGPSLAVRIQKVGLVAAGLALIYLLSAYLHA